MQKIVEDKMHVFRCFLLFNLALELSGWLDDQGNLWTVIMTHIREALNLYNKKKKPLNQKQPKLNWNDNIYRYKLINCCLCRVPSRSN